MKFIVIGITDHPNPFFPPDVLKSIEGQRIFSGGKRHHTIVKNILPEKAVWIDITAPVNGVFDKYREVSVESGVDTVVVFASGDPLFFGFANTIRREMPDANIQLYPSFNSLQTLAHRMIMPYHDMHIVSLTGRPWQGFDQALIEGKHKIGVLTDKEHSPSAIAQRMLVYGYHNYQMTVGEHLGHPDRERITTLSLEEASMHTFEYPNCLILTGGHPRIFGLPENQFELLDDRKNMITKMPIRLLSLQAMELYQRKTMWDIGFCTGSVSIESRLQFPHLDITAFEIRTECEEIMNQNTRRFGAPGIRTVIGDFMETDIFKYPHPDAVFIGGHGGRLKEMIQRVNMVLNEGGCIVMNSVTPQSRQLFEEACHENHLMLCPSTHITINQFNPIDILKCVKP